MRYGLLGEHLGHSFSKEIHESISDYTYELIEVAREDLDAFMTARDFAAINVTIPYKEKVMPYLHWLSPQARAIGAVNVVVNRNGLLYGYNTDFDGLSMLVKSSGADLEGRKVLVLGKGGAAKTAKAVSLQLGASSVTLSAHEHSGDVISYDEIPDVCADAAVIINATPCGMFPHNEGRLVDLDIFSSLEAVVDVVYNPLRTNLVLDAQKRGIKATGGLLMLVAQAVRASELFTGRELPEKLTMECFRSIESSKENLVLVGMPSCGKSTVGGILAERLGRTLVDTDQVVRERIGMEISDFFALNGEQAFRDVESAVVEELSRQSGLVIATGGGAVLREENVRNLKQNGRIILIDRPLDKLCATSDRPLSSSREALERRYAERMPLYRSCADVMVDADRSPAEVASLIQNYCNMLNKNF